MRTMAFRHIAYLIPNWSNAIKHGNEITKIRKKERKYFNLINMLPLYKFLYSFI